MENEKTLITNALLNWDFLRLIATTKSERFPKRAESSINARKMGNDLYIRNDHTAETHEEIFRLYSKSIASAPNNSEELAIGFGNRSALLMHLEKYEHSIRDIDRALKITNSKTLKFKLLKRRTKCFNLLNPPENETGDVFKINEKLKDEEDRKYIDAMQAALNKVHPNEPIENRDILLKELITKAKEFTSKEVYESQLDNLLKLSLNESLTKPPKTKKTNFLKSSEEKSKENLPNSFAIRYNEKYGRHLVATKKIEAGEIIFAEKPYVACLNITRPYIHCCHCLTVAWSGIPCKYCGWFMFCSEKCRAEAWKQYHDIECSYISHLAHFIAHFHNTTGEKVCFDGLSIRALVKGLREAGNLVELKTEIQSIDRCTDNRARGFSKDGKFENDKFRSLYSLTSNISSDELEGHVRFAAMALVCLAKYTSFFGKDFIFSGPEKLASNADVVYIGALILKLSKISNVNSHCINNVNEKCKYSNDLVTCSKNMCCIKGVCIVPIASLTNHNCNPNARRCFTDDLKFILYAVQPIQKNSQICDSYFCSFVESPNPYRQSILKKNFNFECDCIACENNWPSWQIFEMPFEILLETDVKLNSKEMEVYEKNKKLIEIVQSEETEKYDLKLLKDLSKAAAHSMKNLVQPSVITYKLIGSLMQVFEKIYAFKLQAFDGCTI